MLKEALLELLRKEDISRITVTRLCQTAQINRATFYKYYGTPNDLLAEIERDFFEELENQFGNDDLSEESALAGTVAYLDKSRDKMKILLNALSYDSFYDHLTKQDFIKIFLEKNIPRDSALSKDYVRLFFSRGIYAVLREWINNENPESPEDMVNLILSVKKKFER